MLEHQLQSIELMQAFIAGSHQINAGGFYRRVTQNIGETRNVLVSLIVHSGKKMPQVVGKDLAWGNVGCFCQTLHFQPNAAARQRGAVAGKKDFTSGNFMSACIAQQFLAELGWNQDGANLAFEMDVGAPLLCRFHGEGFHFADTNAGAADGFHEQCQAMVACAMNGTYKARVFVAAEVTLGGTKQPALHAQITTAAIFPAQPMKKAIERCQHGIDSDRRIAFLKKGVGPAAHAPMRDWCATQPMRKSTQRTHVLVNGSFGTCFFFQNARY